MKSQDSLYKKKKIADREKKCKIFGKPLGIREILPIET